MSLRGIIYWRWGFWRVHKTWFQLMGSIVCWWKGDHEPVWVMGSLTPVLKTDGRGLYSKIDNPKMKRWCGSYCLRCRKPLEGKPYA